MRQFSQAESGIESDEVILQRITRRDVAAYELFYERHSSSVYSLLMRILHDSSVAEEVTQEVFWQVWQKAEQFAGNGAPAAWLLRMARNRAFDQIRRQRARPIAATAEFSTFEQSTEMVVHDVEQKAEQNWQKQQIQRVLANIPGEQRVCLELAYFEGLSQREIAEKTNTPLGTIKTRMNLGMQKLESMLRAIGFP